MYLYVCSTASFPLNFSISNSRHISSPNSLSLTRSNMSHDSTRSGNSNSKRSFNSLSNNNSSGKNKKTKKSNQKTLGAAWGSNSLSSSRSSFRSAPFSDFGSYMAVKNKKLHDQFDAEASSSSLNESDSTKPIFHGVSIFVDGFTIPSSQELRGYMLKHGGRFENYFSRRRVTHIICSNLPDSKIKNLRSFSGGLPVVKPNWILECVAAGKLLSWVPYQLVQLAGEACKQPKLSAFFAIKSSSVSRDVSSDSTCLTKSEAEDSFFADNTVNDDTTSNVDELSEYIRQGDAVKEHGGVNPIDAPENLETTPRGKELPHSENEMSFTSNDDVYLGSLMPSTSANTHDPEGKATPDSSGSIAGGPSHHRHSTLEDPNFVENYFKSSRLHFIGTWRNRYRKHFGNRPEKVKITMSDVAPACVSQDASIIHVDMDCFFVAVVIRDRKDLMDKPVAVCHSDSSRGTAEISSANYRARDYGVKAGMFVRDAKSRCPHLLIVPYNFEAYEEVADQFYNILHRNCNKVQAVSCDEAFLDVTESDVKDPELLASVIRKEIYETTGCTASAGIGGNLLMARLATRSAKPDGQCRIPLEKVDEYLLQLPVKALPGIGRVLEEKLKRKGVQTCGQLRMYSKESLQKDFGLKTGELLWNNCRGVDKRLVGDIQESKSIGAEVNWGVRFKDRNDSEHFLSSLCKEVSLRLQGCGVQGRTLTLKIKKRRKDADEPAKYMGCGDCENLSHSTTVPVATDDVEVLQRITMQLFASFHIDVKDIRGIGLQVTKLESADNLKQGLEKNSLRSWLASCTASNIEHQNSEGTGRFHREFDQSSPMIPTPSNDETSLNQIDTLPSVEDLDLDVIMNLPADLFRELNVMYGGKLDDYISKRNSIVDDEVAEDMLVRQRKGKAFEEQGRVPDAGQCITQEKDEVGRVKNKELGATSASGAGIATLSNSAVEKENVDFMPSSFSQVDISVLQQLPEELRADIVGALPAHRHSDCLTEPSICVEGVEVRQAGYEPKAINVNKHQDVWAGNPPNWINEFKSSNCLMLNVLAEMFLRSGSMLLSSTLQLCLSQLEVFCDVTEDVDDEASISLCELLRQYIQLKLEVDIEEIYICFRLLKRLTKKSKAIVQVYGTVLLQLQAFVGETYGGCLDLPSVQ